ncbi:MAG TPA: DUF1501 domain-containing protein [Candidatus Limnocylindria bacterium]|nr:DUF1501 domain-containing protein [Candidatus Limnocylindria bacterium]
MKLAGRVAAASSPPDNKALVCIFLNGGCDSFNLLVPTDASRYRAYADSRGATDSPGGLALRREALLPLASPSADFGLHPACVNLQQMANGTGVFAGKRRLAFVSNVGTLIQPITKAQFNAWESGDNVALPVPRALFSHSDQIEQWQTAVPQGMSQLTGWAGRAADILHDSTAAQSASMSISLDGNNIWQVGNSTQQFVITPSGALSLARSTPAGLGDPLQLKNSGLKSMLDQHYANLLTESFSRLTRDSDASQQFFQSQFDSSAGNLGPAVDGLFGIDYLSSTLRAVVKTIKLRSVLGLRRQTFFLTYGGWDNHSELLNAERDLLSVFDTAVGSFQRALEILGLQNDVLTFTASDFGRTLRSNGLGTDNAWGGNSMVFGGGVDGGRIFGTFPDLSLDGPDDVGLGGRILPSTPVDSYIAEMLRWFGVPNGSMSHVLPNIANFWNPNSTQAPLGFIRS